MKEGNKETPSGDELLSNVMAQRRRFHTSAEFSERQLPGIDLYQLSGIA